ncbi:hypothetical protein BBJ28_00012013 [Nothophytophthora sp. Chile5]|nr:hypothetical protein BBJ28_00012013 [Nothophytophthora sp. Chile5]
MTGKQETATVDTATEQEALRRRERRRYQCRVSQRRYRDKKGSAEYNLRMDVNTLRANVQRLCNVREMLQTKIWSSRLALNSAVVKAAEQYYSVFAHGLRNPEGDNDRLGKCFDLQVSFLKAFMDKGVLFGDSRGIQCVIDQWRLYTQFHADMRLQLLSSEVFGAEDSPIVVVKSVLVVRLNRTTIENMFPHILANEELVQVLMRQEIEYPTSTTYVFNAFSQVERQDLNVDFLAGISHCLGNTYATSRVMQHALISDCSKLGQTKTNIEYDADSRHDLTYILA